MNSRFSQLPGALAIGTLAGVCLVGGCATNSSNEALMSSGDASANSSRGFDAARCQLPDVAGSSVPEPTGNGETLEVLHWAGFAAAVSYTFDDSNSSQIAHYDTLQALGVPMTFYLQTGKSESSNAIWEQALADGHELGNHTRSHPQMGTPEELDEASEFIVERFGVTPYTMAAPFGNASYVPLAESRFLINRGVSGGSIAPNGNANRFDLPCYIPPEGAEASALDGIVDGAHAAGNWQLLLVHGFTGGTDGAYQPIDSEQFVQHVEHAKSLPDIWIDSVVRIGAYWVAEQMLAEVTPERSEGKTVWSWQLPEHFPEGMCLRVRTEGGTLTQGGAPLPWDPHGYYHINLDAGSVTLSP